MEISAIEAPPKLQLNWIQSSPSPHLLVELSVWIFYFFFMCISDAACSSWSRAACSVFKIFFLFLFFIYIYMRARCHFNQVIQFDFWHRHGRGHALSFCLQCLTRILKPEHSTLSWCSKQLLPLCGLTFFCLLGCRLKCFSVIESAVSLHRCPGSNGFYRPSHCTVKYGSCK